MRKVLVLLLSLVILGIGGADVLAQNYSFSKRFFFKLGKYDIDETLRDNSRTIDSVQMKVRELKLSNASDIRLHITSFASLEASDAYNATLTFNRTQSLIRYLCKFSVIDERMFVQEENVFDWKSLIELTERYGCPNKEEALRIMRTVSGAPLKDGNLRKSMLQKLDGGATYEYMRERFFPEMRNSMITITANVQPRVDTVYVDPQPANDIQYVSEWIFPRRGVFAFRTNMLYDLLLIPNIGIEAYVTDNISVNLNWLYSWWKSDSRNIYWRAYGGDLHLNYWFDTSQHFWDGHHAGVYAQMLTYDFEWKGRGYQGPRFNWGMGFSYGYAWWLSDRFSIDFSIDVGYLGGKYYTYDPSDKRGIYYIEDTKHLNWFGPTKAEVSLIWKIGKEQ